MIKIETEMCFFIIERKDIKDGIKSLRKRSGIGVLTNGTYRLYDREGVLLYIGRGKKVLNRVIDHMTGKSLNTSHFFKEIERAEIFILPLYDKSEIEDLEQYLILVFNPKYNQLKWTSSTVIHRMKEFEI